MEFTLAPPMNLGNIQQTTSNVQHPIKGPSGNHWVFDVGCWMLDVFHWFRGSMRLEAFNRSAHLRCSHVAQISPAPAGPYRGFPIRQAKEVLSRLEFTGVQPNGIRRYSTARPSRNQWSVAFTPLHLSHHNRAWYCRVASHGRTSKRRKRRAPEESSRAATIPPDTDRLEICATTKRFMGRIPRINRALNP